VYCTPTTARFVAHKLGVPPSALVAVPLDTPVVVESVRVTFVDANHCPGAAQARRRAPRASGPNLGPSL